MPGGGSGGRPLTDTEQSLIQRQIQLTDIPLIHQRRGSEDLRGQISAINRSVEGLRDTATDAASSIGSLSDLATTRGISKLNQEQLLLSRLLSGSNALLGPSQSGSLDRNNRNLASLIGNIPDADRLGQISQLFLNQAGRSPLAQNISSLNDLSAFALNRGMGAPLNEQISTLLNLGARGSGLDTSQLLNLSGRASNIGADPGAAESALTPLTISNLESILSGNIPQAISGLFSGPDAGARSALENQFDAARQRLIDSGVRGGALTRALAGLEGQRALGIGEQAQRRADLTSNAALGLLNQATDFGLNQPFRRQQLNLQGLGLAGELENVASGLGQNEANLRGSLISQSGALGAQQAGISNQLFGLGSDAARAALQGTAEQEALRNQLFGLGSDAAESELRAQLSGLGLGSEILSRVAANDLNLAGLRTDAISRQLGLQQGVASQLGASANNLAFGVAPSLANQAVSLTGIVPGTFGILSDLLTGGAGGGSADLSGALAAASSAANQPGQPSALAAGFGGLTSGAASGAAIGGLFGGVGAPVGAGVGGLLGLLGGVL